MQPCSRPPCLPRHSVCLGVPRPHAGTERLVAPVEYTARTLPAHGAGEQTRVAGCTGLAAAGENRHPVCRAAQPSEGGPGGLSPGAAARQRLLFSVRLSCVGRMSSRHALASTISSDCP